jgi:hypothetical protein
LRQGTKSHENDVGIPQIRYLHGCLDLVALWHAKQQFRTGAWMPGLAQSRIEYLLTDRPNLGHSGCKTCEKLESISLEGPVSKVQIQSTQQHLERNLAVGHPLSFLFELVDSLLFPEGLFDDFHLPGEL